jgi:hypothetical protein
MRPDKTLLRSIVILGATLGVVGPAFGQGFIDNSRANDANNRVGSGGWNESRNTSRSGVGDANYIVTGNVTGAKGFRGPLGYTAPNAFRGNMPSSSFDSFISSSSGITTGGTPSFNALNTQVRTFHGTNTVAPTPGFTRDSTGLRLPTATPSFNPADTRVDFGGLDRAIIARSVLARPVMAQSLNAQRVGTLSDSAYARELSRADRSTPRSLSEFTAMGRRPETFMPKLASAAGTPEAGTGNQNPTAMATAPTGLPTQGLPGMTVPTVPSLAPSIPQLGGVPAATITTAPKAGTPTTTTPTVEAPREMAPTTLGSVPEATEVRPPSVSSLMPEGSTRLTMEEAESLMRAGRFASAIDRFDAAQAVTPDDPRLFLGRTMAELGAGYYRRAYESLVRAGSDERSLHGERVDLVGTLTAARLEFVIRELRQLAVDEPKDPMPLVLLAWIDGNIGNSTRAGEYARRAVERSGNDSTLGDFVKPWTGE